LLFNDIFTQARADGLKVTSHCDVGQKDTHEHIRQCISILCDGQGLDRIDHGLNVADKPELIEQVKAKGIGLTLAPHAYHRRWPDDEVFPVIRKLLDTGVMITINSDDPTYMQDFWIENCLQVMRDHVKCTDAELIQLTRNAITVCWASDDTKRYLEGKLAQFIAQHST
jgi:adenosine deaminase